MDFLCSVVSYFCDISGHPLWCFSTLDEMLEFELAGSFTVFDF